MISLDFLTFRVLTLLVLIVISWVFSFSYFFLICILFWFWSCFYTTYKTLFNQRFSNLLFYDWKFPTELYSNFFLNLMPFFHPKNPGISFYPTPSSECVSFNWNHAKCCNIQIVREKRRRFVLQKLFLDIKVFLKAGGLWNFCVKSKKETIKTNCPFWVLFWIAGLSLYDSFFMKSSW